MAGRRGDYLYKRGDVYWVKFQYPKDSGLKKVQRSTGKKNYDEAWLAVADDIIAHKQFLTLLKQFKRGSTQRWLMSENYTAEHQQVRTILDKLSSLIEKGRSLVESVTEEEVAHDEQARALYDKLKATVAQPLSPRDIIELVTSPARPQQKPFTSIQNLDGTTTFATPNEVYVNDADGNTLATRPNEKVVGIKPIFMSTDERQDILNTIQRKEQLTSRVSDSDWEIIKAYIDNEGKDATWAAEAEETYRHWRQVVGKTFQQADLPDGAKLVKFYREEYIPPKAKKSGKPGIKSATIAKRLNYLSAPINNHMRNKKRRITFNPFVGVISNLGEDATRKKPLFNPDLERIDQNLDKLGDDERLLYLICRHTGCRRGEAWQIEETKEKGLRIMWFGSKNEQSVRRIPIPDALIPYLPKQIEGCLFTGTPKIVGKNVNRALRRFGITDETKTLHSFRHRAKDRLRAEHCPQDIRWAILGHERKTVAEGYGEGFPMTVLKPYVELIGCYDEPDFVPNPDAYNDSEDA